MHVNALSPRFAAAVDPSQRGRVSLIVRDDRDGEQFSQAGDAAFESASMIKLALLAALLAEDREGRIALDDDVSVDEAHRAPGDGLLREWRLPLVRTVRDLAVAMIVLSDNTATNALLDRLGIEALNDRLAAWGYTTTRSRGFVRPRQPDGEGIGTTSAAELVDQLDGIRSARFGTDEASRWAIQVLDHQQDDRALSRFLAPGTRFAHKTGTFATIRHDAGFLCSAGGEPLVTVAVLTEGLGPAIERHDHPAVVGMGLAMALIIRELGLPIQLVPWTPDSLR